VVSILARDLAARLLDRPARVVLGDALETDFENVLSEAGVTGPVALASNLPYESATPMIRKFVRHPEWFSSLTVMIQKEVADRLLAPPAGEAYGYLTLDVSSHAVVTKLFDVGPKNFDPPPKVMSTVLSLTPRIPDEGTDAALLVASLGFAHRRKKLINGLESRWDREEIRTALSAVGIPEGLRAEVLSWQNFLSLARALGPAGAPEPGC
jgi:16S rRNA (adenine1518-N6/adenine1519-N6)-dimethyltransferase